MLMWLNLGIAVLAFSRALILQVVNYNASKSTNAANTIVEHEVETKTVPSAEESVQVEVIACTVDDTRVSSAACA